MYQTAVKIFTTIGGTISAESILELATEMRRVRQNNTAT